MFGQPWTVKDRLGGSRARGPPGGWRTRRTKAQPGLPTSDFGPSPGVPFLSYYGPHLRSGGQLPPSLCPEGFHTCTDQLVCTPASAVSGSRHPTESQRLPGRDQRGERGTGCFTAPPVRARPANLHFPTSQTSPGSAPVLDDRADS